MSKETAIAVHFLASSLFIATCLICSALHEPILGAAALVLAIRRMWSLYQLEKKP